MVDARKISPGLSFPAQPLKLIKIIMKGYLPVNETMYPTYIMI